MVVYYDYHMPMTKSLLSFKNTAFRTVIKSPDFWAFIFFHLVTVSIAFGMDLNGEDTDDTTSVIDSFPWESAATASFFMTFFITFYNEHCFGRFNVLYDQCTEMMDEMLLFVHELVVSFPGEEFIQHRTLATKYMLATIYLVLMVQTGGALTLTGWKELMHKGLLTRIEIEVLSAYPGGGVTLVLTNWAMQVVDEALDHDCRYQPGVRSEEPHYVHNRHNKHMVAMIKCAHKIESIIALPIPFPYYHLMNLVLVCNFILGGFLVAIFQNFLTVFPYAMFVAMFMGIRQVAVELADPFGMDEVDFPIVHFLNYTFENAMCLLEVFHAVNPKRLEACANAIKDVNDEQLVMSVEKKKLYKGQTREKLYVWTASPLQQLDPDATIADVVRDLLRVREQKAADPEAYDIDSNAASSHDDAQAAEPPVPPTQSVDSLSKAANTMDPASLEKDLEDIKQVNEELTAERRAVWAAIGRLEAKQSKKPKAVPEEEEMSEEEQEKTFFETKMEEIERVKHAIGGYRAVEAGAIGTQGGLAAPPRRPPDSTLDSHGGPLPPMGSDTAAFRDARAATGGVRDKFRVRSLLGSSVSASSAMGDAESEFVESVSDPGTYDETGAGAVPPDDAWDRVPVGSGYNGMPGSSGSPMPTGTLDSTGKLLGSHRDGNSARDESEEVSRRAVFETARFNIYNVVNTMGGSAEAKRK
eukprot:NODE_1827_length_2365_cov_8.514745.p1 GENE.NODE_1827_length_2365_cov_8.514745~~NODE_1827_length_2365_cov_8.514745.p1  ORF type:complete len:697 (+),score=146.82 NODE_1827_length_2365_cov_8.514745:136-2226(+)